MGLTDDRAPTNVGSDDVEGLHRTLTWRGGVWIASGVPALVLFSIGDIATTVGAVSWLVWTLSVTFGMVQSATYAEIAGLYPSKDRKSTRLNSSHVAISYAVFC